MAHVERLNDGSVNYECHCGCKMNLIREDGGQVWKLQICFDCCFEIENIWRLNNEVI